MFTTVDKALVSLVLAVISLANLYFGFEPGTNVNAIALEAAISMIWPILVWAIPNLQPPRR